MASQGSSAIQVPSAVMYMTYAPQLQTMKCSDAASKPAASSSSQISVKLRTVRMPTAALPSAQRGQLCRGSLGLHWLSSAHSASVRRSPAESHRAGRAGRAVTDVSHSRQLRDRCIAQKTMLPLALHGSTQRTALLDWQAAVRAAPGWGKEGTVGGAHRPNHSCSNQTPAQTKLLLKPLLRGKRTVGSNGGAQRLREQLQVERGVHSATHEARAALHDCPLLQCLLQHRGGGAGERR